MIVPDNYLLKIMLAPALPSEQSNCIFNKRRYIIHVDNRMGNINPELKRQWMSELERIADVVPNLAIDYRIIEGYKPLIIIKNR